ERLRVASHTLSYLASLVAAMTSEISPLSLHDALPISLGVDRRRGCRVRPRRRLDGEAGLPVCPSQQPGLSQSSARRLCHPGERSDRKSTRLNSSHRTNSYAVCCLKKKHCDLRG